MSFTLYPDPPLRPLPVPAGATVFMPFVARSAPVAEFDPPYPQVMFLRVAMLRGSSAPTLLVAAGTGTPVEVSDDPQGVFSSAGGVDYVGDVSATRLGANVFDVFIGLVSVGPGLAWRLGIRNTDAAEGLYTWVVADRQVDTAQPWVDPGPPDYRVTATIPVTATPYAIAYDSTRQSAYVAGPQSMSVIDLPTRAVVDDIALPFPPLCIAVDPVTHTVYLSHAQASAIAAIDAGTGALTLIQVPPSGAVVLAVDAARRTLYAWGHDFAAGAGKHAVLTVDADTRRIAPPVSVGQHNAADLAIEPTTHTVYAAGIEPDGLLIYDPDSRTVTPIPVNKPARRVAIDPLTPAAYLSSPRENALLRVDPVTQVVTAIAVGRMPSGVVVDPGVYTVYVANRLDNSVTAIDTRTHVQTVIPAGEGAQSVAVDATTHTALVTNTAAGTVSVIERGR